MTSLPRQQVGPASHPWSPAAASLTIRISTGTGTGTTPLSAFDAALLEAGVGNYNLVRLSSVIPTQADVVRVGRGDQLQGGWGDRLYCVYADARCDLPGAQAWAGIGWVTSTDGSGAGLFVEHEAHGRDEVVRAITASLGDLVAGRCGDFGPVQMEVAGIACEQQPVAALVVATYQTASWAAPGSQQPPHR